MKQCLAILLSLVLMLSLVACAKKQTSAPASSQINTSAAAQTTAAPTTTLPATTAATTQTTAKEEEKELFNLSHYAHLTKGEKKVYKRVLEAIKQGKASIPESLEEFDAQIVDRIYFYEVLPDYPQYFHVRAGSVLMENSATGEKSAQCNFQFIYSSKKYCERSDKIESIYRSIKASLPADAGDLDKARAVYDYLIDHCAYDYSYSGNSTQEAKTTASFADGALIDSKAVCSGYSRAFKLLMNKFGIACMCVCNADHEWNLVFIDGVYYHIDITWADDGSSNRYKYFCVSDAVIYKNHDKPSMEMPACATNIGK